MSGGDNERFPIYKWLPCGDDPVPALFTGTETHMPFEVWVGRGLGWLLNLHGSRMTGRIFREPATGLIMLIQAHVSAILTSWGCERAAPRAGEQYATEFRIWQNWNFAGSSRDVRIPLTRSSVNESAA